MSMSNYPGEEWDPQKNPIRKPPEEQSFLEGWNRLSPRMRQVARLVALDVSNREIAQRLRISPGTVVSHMHMIFIIVRIHSRKVLKERMWSEGPFRGP